MSVETFIGWRYLKSKRKQTFISVITLISLAGVALGVMALIVVIAVMSGFEEDLKSKILGANSHIVVLPSDQPLEENDELVDRVATHKGVVSVEPFVSGQVMLGSYGGVAGAVLRGIDPRRAGKNGQIGRIIIDGDLADLESDETGIFLGTELARELGKLKRGDTIKVISPLGQITPLGHRAPRVRNFKLVGTIKSGVYEFDSMIAYISLSQAQDFLSLGRTITGLDVKVDDVYRADKIREDIMHDIGPSYTARDWMEMNSSLFSALKMEKAAMFVILTLTVLVAAFNIISTLIMVVMEKTHDIAILVSMGATRRIIMKIFVFQGLFIGVAGTLAGLMGGVFLCELLARYEFIKLPDEVYYISTLPVRMEAVDVALITCSAVLFSFLAALYPAWQASRLNPVEALRYE